MFKYGYKYRVKGYEELLKEKGVKRDVLDTIFKIDDEKAIYGFTKKMECFKNVLLCPKFEQEVVFIENQTSHGSISPWMCECLGEIIEPICKFEVGKIYTVLKWNELLRVKNVILSTSENGVDKIINEAIDRNYVIKNKMFNDIFGKEIIIDKEDFINPSRGTIIFNGWEVSPWMCKEVETKEKPKEEKQSYGLKEKRYYSLNEVIEQLSNNPNLTFIHPISKTELTKNIAGIELINPQEVLFTEGWERKKEPVTFQEAVAKGTKFMVEHEILDKRFPKDYHCSDKLNVLLNMYINDFINKKYLTLSSLMSAMAWNITGEELQKVIQEGEWFYE